jgi:hypothetical protein
LQSSTLRTIRNKVTTRSHGFNIVRSCRETNFAIDPTVPRSTEWSALMIGRRWQGFRRRSRWKANGGLDERSELWQVECHRVVDLLADRTAASTADWLRKHKEVGVASRDRTGLYADGARQAAPQGRQSMPQHEFGSQVEHHPGCDCAFTRRRISVFPRSGIPRKIRACSVPSGLSVAFSL